MLLASDQFLWPQMLVITNQFLWPRCWWSLTSFCGAWCWWSVTGFCGPGAGDQRPVSVALLLVTSNQFIWPRMLVISDQFLWCWWSVTSFCGPGAGDRWPVSVALVLVISDQFLWPWCWWSETSFCAGKTPQAETLEGIGLRSASQHCSMATTHRCGESAGMSSAPSWFPRELMAACACGKVGSATAVLLRVLPVPKLGGVCLSWLLICLS